MSNERGFWEGRFEKASIDVRVFNPNAQSNCNTTLSALYHKHNRKKIWQYDQQICEAYIINYTQLVFSVTGGMCHAAIVFFKRLASMIAEKRDIPYNLTLKCRLNFALLRASNMSVRGSRSSIHPPVFDGPIDLQVTEGHLG